MQLQSPHSGTFHRFHDFLQRQGMALPARSIVVVWGTGLIILLGLSFTEFFPLLDEYLNNNVGTQARVFGQNKTVKPPLLTLCLPRPTLSPMPKLPLNPALAEMAEGLRDAAIHGDKANSQGTDFANLIFKFLVMNDYKFDKSTTNTTDWVRALLDGIWDMFHCIKKLDMAMSAYHKDGTRHECFGEAWTNIDRVMMPNKTYLESLFSLLVDVLCDFADLRGDTENNPTNELCKRVLMGTPSVILADQFCFALPMLDRNSSKAYISSNPNSNYVARSGSNASSSGWALYSDIDYLSLETSDNFFSYPVFVSDQTAELVYLGYSITAVAIDKRHKDCFHERSPAVCRSNCIIAAVRRSCRCDPFLFRNHTPLSAEDSQLPYCNSSSYDTCDMDRSKATEECEQKCIHQCVSTMFQFSVVRQGTSRGRLLSRKKQEHDQRNEQKREFDVLVYPISGAFLEFIIIYRNTWEQFLTQIGSIVNLYLGFSGISVIVLVLTIGKACRHCFWPPKEPSILPVISPGTGEGCPKINTGTVPSSDIKFDFFVPGYTYNKSFTEWNSTETWRMAMEAKYAQLEKKLEELQMRSNKR